jgi:uncharacterized iron-regulated protein
MMRGGLGSRQRWYWVLMRLFLVLLVTVLGCGPVAASGEAQVFTSKLDRDLPLVGKIWQPGSAAMLDERTLVSVLAKSEFVLIGEQHDNPDHHRLEATILAELLANARKPTVALEMLEPADDALIQHYREDPRADAAGIGPLLAWDMRGWPRWSAYAPIADLAFKAGLPLVSANLSRSVVRRIAHEGTAAVPADEVAALGLDQPLDPRLEASLEEELRSSHCGQLPEAMVVPMALAQRARDGQMARSMLAASPPVVLMAGAGHVRTDRGVPVHLHTAKPQALVVSVAFVEVDRTKASPADYASRFGSTTVPFDYVWFTPRASDVDPCAAFPSIKDHPLPKAP